MKDVTDWLDTGHTVEELVGLAQKAPPWSPGPIEAPRPSVTAMSIDDVLAAAGLNSLGQSPSPQAIEAALVTLRDAVKEADPVRRAVLRETSVQILSRVGLRTPAALVDAALGPRENDPPPSAPGQPLALSDPEFWPDQVDGAELLNDLLACFTSFLRLPIGGAVALAIWTLHAHAHDATAVSPILTLKSAAKRSGKTTALTVLSALVPRPLMASNVTPAAIFRTVDMYLPTLLVDEADSFLTANEEIRGILNSGHTRAGAIVIRTVGENHEACKFSTWCPKAIALIGNLPGTLEDRSIILEMRRRAPADKVDRLRLDRLQELEPLRRRAARWTQDHQEVLRKGDPAVPDQLHDRAADNWRPLVAIADLCGGIWPEEARRAARILSGNADEGDTTPGIQLLADLHAMFVANGEDRLPSKQIVQTLIGMEDRPWPEWRNGKPLTDTQLARILKPFSVGPKGIRLKDGTTPRGYLLADLEDPFARYLPPEVQHPQQINDDNDLRAESKCNTDPPVAPLRNDEKPRQMGIVAGVAPPEGKPPGVDKAGAMSAAAEPEVWEEF